MNELRRMHYLDAMGIESFMPRYVLPAAQKPVLCPLPVAKAQQDNTAHAKSETVVPQASSTPIPTHVPVARNPAAILDAIAGADTQNAVQDVPVQQGSANEEAVDEAAKALVDNVVESIVDTANAGKANIVTKSDSAPEPATPKSAEALKPISFSLSLWMLSDDLLVIDTRRPGDALPTQALLENILKTLKRSPIPFPAADPLNWPMVGADDATWVAARQMIHGFLEARLFDKPSPLFLLFGEDAYSAVLGEEAAGKEAAGEEEQGLTAAFEEKLYQSVPFDFFSTKAVVLPSLGDILRTPEDKAKVWRALRTYQLTGNP